jgi:hypothetical protein
MSLICLAWAGGPDTPLHHEETDSRWTVCAPLLRGSSAPRTLSNPSGASGRRELAPAAASITSEPALASDPAEGRPRVRCQQRSLTHQF